VILVICINHWRLWPNIEHRGPKLSLSIVARNCHRESWPRIIIEHRGPKLSSSIMAQNYYRAPWPKIVI